VPVDCGVKVTLIVHLLEAGTEVPQVLVWAKFPVMVMLVMVRAVALLLAKVAVNGALVVPTVVVGNVNEVGETVTPVTPLPLKLTVCGLLLALSVTVTVPVACPVLVGLKVTEIAQLLPAFTELPQVLVSAKGPEMVMLVMVRVAVPVFARVILRAALVVPTA
jgi:hypothetical protein